MSAIAAFPTTYCLDLAVPPPVSEPRPADLPTLNDIAAIAAIANPVRRNLLITLTYHDLKLALANLLGQMDVSWCAYATWASRTAGTFIRKEMLGGMIDTYLGSADMISQALTGMNRVLAWFNTPVRIDLPFIGTILAETTDGISRNIAHGNLIVFEELAPLYTRMLALFAGSSSYDQSRLDQLLASLQPGPVDEGGQEYLIIACKHYYRALFERNPKARAERILLANLLVGYHEQIRLQGPIVASMEAPLDEALENELLIAVVSLLQLATPDFVEQMITPILAGPLKALAAKLAEDWRELTTHWVMTLALPEETLNLGRDVPPPGSGKMFPDVLTTPQLPELATLIGKLDRAPATSHGSAARDWGRVDERMNFIADFFRSRQQDRSLYRQPFNDAQIAILRAGGVPGGQL